MPPETIIHPHELVVKARRALAAAVAATAFPVESEKLELAARGLLEASAEIEASGVSGGHARKCCAALHAAGLRLRLLALAHSLSTFELEQRVPTRRITELLVASLETAQEGRAHAARAVRDWGSALGMEAHRAQ